MAMMACDTSLGTFLIDIRRAYVRVRETVVSECTCSGNSRYDRFFTTRDMSSGYNTILLILVFLYQYIFINTKIYVTRKYDI